MGFFDFVEDIFQIAVPVLDVFSPGGGNILAGAGSLLGLDLEDKPAAVAKPGGSLGNISGAAGTQMVVAGATAGGAVTTGGLRRRTLIETFNPATGNIVKREIHKGAVAVFSSDVAAANRLNRALKRLNKKQPKKLIRQSAAAMLKEQVIENALRRAAGFDGACPPKQC